MSKQHRSRGDAGSPGSPVGSQGVRGAAVIVFAAAIIVAIGFGLWRATRDEATSAAPADRAAGTAGQPSPAVETADGFQKLKGKWVRPDGGYVLEIGAIEDDGKMDASYSNPQPINVSKAQASQVGAVTKVFIELRDVNYPGSTYDLTYDPQTEQLKGAYYQAALQQRYEVVFVRMN